VGLVVKENKKSIFPLNKEPIFSGLTTAQAVDPLPLNRDFPGFGGL
jgi:hypothetical protein